MFTTWAGVAQGQTDQHPLQSWQSQKADLLSSHNEPFWRNEVFDFDIVPSRWNSHLEIEESIDGIAFPGGVKGDVNFAAGDVGQRHAFKVLVRMSSWNEEALDRVVLNATEEELTITSTPASSLSQPGIEDDLDNPLLSCIRLTVVVFVRPRSLQFAYTRVKSQWLNIKLWKGLFFETYNMTLSTTFGSIFAEETDAFTAHKVHADVVYGSITGNWSLPSSISLAVRQGTIDINLIPKMWSHGPYTEGDFKATADMGNIAVRMPLEKSKLSLRNGTTSIHTRMGSITAMLVHGARTALSTVYGNINATILPHWAFMPWNGEVQFNTLSTVCSRGAVHVDVLTPIVDSYYQIQPLCFAESEHRVESGALMLQYPREWCGIATGRVGEAGYLEVKGEDYELVERNRTYVELQRRPLGSRMVFEVDEGVAELVMK